MRTREQEISFARPTDRLLSWTRWTFSAIALMAWALAIGNTLRATMPPGWVMAVLVLSATTATLLALADQLPGENVLLAAGIIGFIGGLAHGIGVVTAIPFGPLVYLDAAGPKIFRMVAWPLPFLWIFIVLNSRGVARLILRPWRKVRSYGFWLIGIAAVLTALFDAALEPFATRVHHYWIWNPTRLPFTWESMPVTNFFGWLFIALLILAFATPCLINKNPRPKQSPPDYHPLAMWLTGLVLFGAGATVEKLWAVAVFCLTLAVVTAFYAIRGARW